MKSVTILHFADAHIDIANFGRHDPQTALPVRVVDYLKSLDQIVDHAVNENVDLVLFAGDAYKNRNPQPTFQREWGRRMMRLSEAGIPTLLLTGNHDVSPASGRAHTLQEFSTLAVPNVYVADRLAFWDPDQLGVPVQVITIPYVSRSALVTREEAAGKSLKDVLAVIEEKVATALFKMLDGADPELPLIVTAHTGVQGAKYGSERAVMLGQELVLSTGLLSDRRINYVALGHIHRHQSLNDGRQPPIVYAGSIERIDFGEAKEAKGFVTAVVSKEHCDWTFHELETRKFINIACEPVNQETFMQDILRALPSPEEVASAICRVQLTYPSDWDPLLDERSIYDRFDGAFSVQIHKHRRAPKRARLGDIVSVEALEPLELLDQYWQSIGLDKDEVLQMQDLARRVFTAAAMDEPFSSTAVTSSLP